MARREVIICDMCGKTTENIDGGVSIDGKEKELCPTCKTKIVKFFQSKNILQV